MCEGPGKVKGLMGLRRPQTETGVRGQGTTFKRMIEPLWIQQKLVKTDYAQDGGRFDFR